MQANLTMKKLSEL